MSDLLHLDPNQTSPASLSDDVALLCAEIAVLREALERRPAHDQAKGILMLLYGLDPEHAGEVLDLWSSHLHVSARTVALTLIANVAAGQPLPEPPPHLLRPDHWRVRQDFQVP